MTASVDCEDFSNISKGFGVQRVYLYKDLRVTFFSGDIYISADSSFLYFIQNFIGKTGREFSSVADPVSHLVDPQNSHTSALTLVSDTDTLAQTSDITHHYITKSK